MKMPEYSLLVAEVNTILARFPDTKLTLRQIYYQLVAAMVIENNIGSYKALSHLLVRARELGDVDDSKIEDRGRQTFGGDTDKTDPSTFYQNYEDWFRDCWRQYSRPVWEGQPKYTEVWCFPEGTPVITNDGVKTIEKITPSDFVMTASGGFNEVIATTNRKYDGNLIKIKAAGLLEIQCTPNHEFLTAQFIGSKSRKGADRRIDTPKYIKSEKLAQFDFLLVPRIKETKDVAMVSMLEKKPRKGKTPIQIVDLPFDMEFCKIIGFYLSEGNITTNGRTVQFTFNEKKVEYSEIVKTFGKKLGFSPYFYKGKGTIVAYISSKALANWFSYNFGRGARNKKLPSWVMTLPEKKQMEILKCYFQGDGTYDKSVLSLSVSSKSIHLIFQTQMILIRNGFFCTASTSYDYTGITYCLSISGESGRRLCSLWGIDIPRITKKSYNWGRILENYVYFPIRSVLSEPYLGIVYNIEVKNEHSYCVPCVVHNCEKDALSRIVSDEAGRYGVTTCVARGYSSYTFVRNAAERINRICGCNRLPIILYFGDHDPSGEDMVRDLGVRLQKYGVSGGENIVEKIALTSAQIREYKLPSSPTKEKDVRAKKFISEHGDEVVELDALDPNILKEMVKKAIIGCIDVNIWNKNASDSSKEKEIIKSQVDAHFAGDKK